MFIAHRAGEKKAFVLIVCATLGHCAGLSGAEVISFIVAGRELHFGLVPNHSPMLKTIP